MKRFFVLCSLTILCMMPGNAQSTPTLTLHQTIALPGVSGKFDHFAIDLPGQRLFAAATANHTVEVIDLKTGKVAQSIAGLGKPHGLVWSQSTQSLYVADGSLAELRAYHGTPFELAGTIKLSDDADDMVFDELDHLLYVGHGGAGAAVPGRLAIVDTTTFRLIGNLIFAAHPEALDMDAAGRRIFANIADAGEVGVIDGVGGAITAHWKLSNATNNVPMAYDAARHLLYVACRKPAVLLALDANTGAEISRVAIGDGADDLFYDPSLGRIYVISGAGEVDVVKIDATKILHALSVVKTASGAKTALFVPAQNLLYVGVPGTGDNSAEIRVYTTSTAEAGK
jgi:DNA-binding beta-propeller fold protein YncE